MLSTTPSPYTPWQCYTGFWHTGGSISLYPLVMHLFPLLGIISWRVKTISHSSSWPQKLTQARHRALTPHTNDKENQRMRDFNKWSACHLPHRGSHKIWQLRVSSVTSPGSLVECQEQKPDGNFCQLLWKFHITEMVSGDNILKANKMQKYL